MIIKNRENVGEDIGNDQIDPWQVINKGFTEGQLTSWVQHGMPPLFSKFIELVTTDRGGRLHLDIGCNSGVKTVNFSKVGLSVIGIDVSYKNLHEAEAMVRTKYPEVRGRCRFALADCRKLPFADNSINSVSDLFCFTHLYPKDQDQYQGELRRVLKDGGYALLGLFSDKDEHFHGHPVSKGYTFHFDPRNPEMVGFSHYEGMYNAHFNRQDILELFGGTFKIQEIEEYQHPLYPHRWLWNVILQNPKGGTEGDH